MNIALIFAGGVGSRMNNRSKPKQFLELHGKPIIVYTLEIFQSHPEIDAIVISVVHAWEKHMTDLIIKFNLSKVVDVVVGGETGQTSIFNGLVSIEKKFPLDSTVLIHDGVRPLINHETISGNINQTKLSGNAITTAPTIETFVIVNEDMRVQEVPERRLSRLAKAPQSFRLKDIIEVHRQAMSDGVIDSIDSCTLMRKYGHSLTLVEGNIDNIKITTPTDYFLFRAILEARENNLIFGG